MKRTNQGEPVAVRELFVESPRPRRSPVAAAVSFAAHALALGGVVALAWSDLLSPRLPERDSITFLAFFEPPPVPVEPVAPPPLRQPAVELAADRPVAPPEVRPAPPVMPRQPEPVAVEASVPPPPVPAPRVQVGLFSTPQPGTDPAAPPRDTKSAGFDAAPSVAAPLKTPLAAAGAFDAQPAAPRPGTDRPAVGISTAGFDRTTGSAAPAAVAGRVAQSGFGMVSDNSVRAPRQPAVVRPGGFGEAAPATPVVAANRPAVDRSQLPVEVLFKPVPAYTDDARARGIQGEVLLEVEFTAAGKVRVLRVVRGLGYGLDENASRAAEGIRFKPAVANGQPRDFRATVEIVFRLT